MLINEKLYDVREEHERSELKLKAAWDARKDNKNARAIANMSSSALQPKKKYSHSAPKRKADKYDRYEFKDDNE